MKSFLDKIVLIIVILAIIIGVSFFIHIPILSDLLNEIKRYLPPFITIYRLDQ